MPKVPEESLRRILAKDPNNARPSTIWVTSWLNATKGSPRPWR